MGPVKSIDWRLGLGFSLGLSLSAFFLIQTTQVFSSSDVPQPEVSPIITYPPTSGPGVVVPGIPVVPTPAVSPEPAPVNQVAPAKRLGFFEMASMRRQFRSALAAEFKALRHRNGLEMKELTASQKARTREWKEKENASRRKIFSEKMTAQERRAYFKEREIRYKAFLKILSDEKNQRAQEHKAREKAIQQDQAAKVKEFDEFLSRGDLPPEGLWPAGQ